jgi:predicted ATPase
MVVQTTYIRSVSVATGKTQPFPFSIPAIQFARKINMAQPITIFIGDNGCGKSTLLESIALKMKLPLIGGHINAEMDPSFEAAVALQDYVDIEWGRQTYNGFFFRAEDFSDFIYQTEDNQHMIDREMEELRATMDPKTFKQFTEGMNTKMKLMRREYGDNMQAYSHGEAYLKIMHMRIQRKGVYILDEPEAALSPIKQLSLIALILDIIKKEQVQFVIATHSPIVMGIPGACLYEIKEAEGIAKVNFRDTEHYRITRSFLEDPDQYLRYLQ